MTEETDKQFVERMWQDLADEDEDGQSWHRLLALALRGAETQDEDGTPKTMRQNGMKIAAEQIPFPVQKALRKTLLDGETDERRAIAAALNAWPWMETHGHTVMQEWITPSAIILPLTALGEPPATEKETRT